MSDFITSYKKHTSIYESPSSFWKWSAYGTIASVMRDKCYIRSGDSFLYPNVYLLIIAESSGQRKNRPIELSQTLVNSIDGIKTISGRSSVQALLDELARGETDPKTGKVLKSNSATFYAPELSAGIVNDPEGMKILTDIYDYKTNPYKNRLRTGPSFDLQKIVFSMISGSNEEMLKTLFDISVIKGGFLARTFLVVPDEFRPSNSLLRVDHEALKKSKGEVISHLTAVNSIGGEFNLQADAIDEFEKWYNPFRQAYKAKKESSGIIGRIHTHILKLSMILAANELSKSITKAHIECAIQECLLLIPNYSIFTMNSSKSDLAQAGAFIIQDLLESPDYTGSRKDILRAHWMDGVDNEMMDKVASTLESAGMIQQVLSKNEMYFRLTKIAIDNLKGGTKA